MKISVIIPTYKKTEMLIENLATNVSFFKSSEVIVVNDDPTQSIKEDIDSWPHIKLIEDHINRGFAGAVNRAAQVATGDYLMLLNSDVRLRNDSYLSALSHFEHDPDLFAVSFAQIEKDGETVGKNRIFWERGFFRHSRAHNLDQGITGWAEGGAAIMERKKFEALDGFDEIYNPFYWEDIDLSYRAWKTGYHVLFDPNVMVEHHHESTIGSFFSKDKIRSIAYRNQLLFIWHTITDPDLIKSHRLALVKQVIKALFTDFPFLIGYIQALGTIKSTKKHHFIRSDHEIFEQFNT